MEGGNCSGGGGKENGRFRIRSGEGQELWVDGCGNEQKSATDRGEDVWTYPGIGNLG
jgi:hypothetical protein